MEGVVHCLGCGKWLMATMLSCNTCKTIQTTKGNSDAESNQREETMVKVAVKEKGEG